MPIFEANFYVVHRHDSQSFKPNKQLVAVLLQDSKWSIFQRHFY